MKVASKAKGGEEEGEEESRQEEGQEKGSKEGEEEGRQEEGEEEGGQEEEIAPLSEDAAAFSVGRQGDRARASSALARLLLRGSAGRKRHPEGGIHGLVLGVDCEMQVGPRGYTGGADAADDLSLGGRLSLGDRDLG